MSSSVELIDTLIQWLKTNNPVQSTLKCHNCDSSISRTEQKECCECNTCICSKCGIIDDSIMESLAPYICRECIPVECYGCGRILIDENIWEENVAYCEGCDKLFCDYNLSSNCIFESNDGIFECRHCIKQQKVLTDVDTLQKYQTYLEENDTKENDDTFEEWVKTQNDPDIKYEMRKQPQPPDAPLIMNHSEDEIRKSFMESTSCLSREMILDIQTEARTFGRTPAPLKCETCGSAEKERYFMLRTDFVSYECIDCAVENAVAK